MMTYTLINYFDVVGNLRDGYEVNNQCTECDDLYLSDDCTNKDIIRYLYKQGYLATCDRRRVGIEDYGDLIEVYAKKAHVPLFGLMPNV